MMRAPILFLLILLDVFAQSSTPQPFQLQWTKVSMPDSTGPLNISLDDRVGHWVVGAKVNAAIRDRVEVTDAGFKVGPHGFRRLTGVSAHTSGQIVLTGRTVSIGSPASPEATLVVFVELSSPRVLNISQGPNPAMSVLVSNTAVVADGSVRDSALSGDFELILIAQTLISTPAQLPIFSSATPDNTILDMADLRSHLVHYVDFNKATAGTAGPRQLVARVDIGADGTVQKVGCPGPSSLCDLITTNVSQWSFRPYLSKGVPVAVVASVPIVVLPTGDIVSAISPSADVR